MPPMPPMPLGGVGLLQLLIGSSSRPLLLVPQSLAAMRGIGAVDSAGPMGLTGERNVAIGACVDVGCGVGMGVGCGDQA